MESKWQTCIHEIIQDFSIRQIRQSNFIEVVILHKFIENISTKDNSLRNAYRNIWEPVEESVSLDNRIQKRKPSGFPTDEYSPILVKLTYSSKFSRLNWAIIPLPLLSLLTGNGIKHKTADFIQIGKISRANIFKEFSQRE